MKIIASFQKEWQTGSRIGARSIMGSFGGTTAQVSTAVKQFFVLFHEISFTMKWKHEQGYMS